MYLLSSVRMRVYNFMYLKEEGCDVNYHVNLRSLYLMRYRWSWHRHRAPLPILMMVMKDSIHSIMNSIYCNADFIWLDRTCNGNNCWSNNKTYCDCSGIYCNVLIWCMFFCCEDSHMEAKDRCRGKRKERKICDMIGFKGHIMHYDMYSGVVVRGTSHICLPCYDISHLGLFWTAGGDTIKRNTTCIG